MHKTVFNPKTDFKDLKYDVFSVDKNLLDKVTGLQKYAQILSEKESKGRDDIDNLLRFMFLLYDKKSPLILMFQNLDQRRKEAAALAGYDVDSQDSEYQKKLKHLFEFTDSELQWLTLPFLEEQNDMWFCNLMSSERTFYEYCRALMTEAVLVDGDKDKMATLVLKAKLQDECDKLAERIDKYRSKIYGDGVEKFVANKKDYSPEAMARRK
jgi:hypothetical protein